MQVTETVGRKLVCERSRCVVISKRRAGRFPIEKKLSAKILFFIPLYYFPMKFHFNEMRGLITTWHTFNLT